MTKIKAFRKDDWHCDPDHVVTIGDYLLSTDDDCEGRIWEEPKKFSQIEDEVRVFVLSLLIERPDARAYICNDDCGYERIEKLPDNIYQELVDFSCS